MGLLIEMNASLGTDERREVKRPVSSTTKALPELRRGFIKAGNLDDDGLLDGQRLSEGVIRNFIFYKHFQKLLQNLIKILEPDVYFHVFWPFYFLVTKLRRKGIINHFLRHLSTTRCMNF